MISLELAFRKFWRFIYNSEKRTDCNLPLSALMQTANSVRNFVISCPHRSRCRCAINNEVLESWFFKESIALRKESWYFGELLQAFCTASNVQGDTWVITCSYEPMRYWAKLTGCSVPDCVFQERSLHLCLSHYVWCLFQIQINRYKTKHTSKIKYLFSHVFS
jgi:hypothetical protein